MSDEVEGEHDPLGERLERFREVATALIDRVFGSMPTRRDRNCTVLSHLLTYLQRLEATRWTAEPIRLHRSDIEALRGVVAGSDSVSSSARARLGALAWLLEVLEKEGLILAPAYRFGLQGPRDLAVHITAEAFRDAGLLSSTLTAAFLQVLEPTYSDRGENFLADCVITALIWEGPIVLAQAPRLLQALRLGDYNWETGALRIYPSLPAAKAAGTKPGFMRERRPSPGQSFRCPLRVFLRPMARLLLNSYLLRRAQAGTLDLREKDAFLFPSLPVSSTKVQRRRLGDRLAACVARLLGSKGEKMAPRRLIRAARVQALEALPPIAIAVLADRLRYSPVSDDVLIQLTGHKLLPVPPRTSPSPATMESQAVSTPAGPSEPDRCGGTENSAWEAVYLDALEGWRAVERLLEQPESRVSRNEVTVVAEDILAQLEAELRALPTPTPPPVVNLRLALRWLVWQLTHPRGTKALSVKCARASVLMRIRPLPSVLELLVVDQELLDLDEDDWIDLALDAMALSTTPDARKSMRHRIKAFHAYLRAYESDSGRLVPTVQWACPELAVASELSESSLLLPWEIDAVRAWIRQRWGKVRGVMLDVFILLAAAGLRRTETCQVRLGDVHILGNEVLIIIRRIKSRNAYRILPLHCLLTQADLDWFRQFYAQRWRETGGNPEAPLLATAASPEGFTPKELARKVAKAIQEVTGKPLTVHSLRHFFASVFPLRWFVAFHGREAAGSLGRVLETPLFSEEALARFRQLFVPATWDGRPVTTHPFEILSILMGHGGPEITVNVYIHTLDWLQRLYVDREVASGREPRLSMPQAAGALLRSLPTVYTMFPEAKKRRGIPCSRVVETQVKRLNQWTSSGTRRPCRSVGDNKAAQLDRAAESS